MQIKSIQLHPFGKFTNETLAFSHPLHFLAQHNEWGKSTLFNAIQTALFVPANLTTAKQRDAVGHYFPAPMGDVIRITLKFEISGQGEYTIFKEWKKNNQGNARLMLPNNIEVIDHESIKNELEKAIPVSLSVFKNILSAPQSALHLTFDQLKQDQESHKNLGDILKKNLLQGGNISIETFRKKLQEKIDELTPRWDFNANYPENNRGVDNQYKSGHGEIVKKYYEKEILKRDIKTASQLENEYEAASNELSGINQELDSIKSEIQEYAKIEVDLNLKNQKENESNRIAAEHNNIMEVSRNWILVENKLPLQEIELQNLTAQKQNLTENRQEAQSYAIKNQRKILFQRVTDLKNALDQAQKALMDLPKYTRQDLEALQQLNAKEKILQTAVLKLDIQRKSSGKMVIQRINQEDEVVPEQLTTSAPGYFKLISDDFQLEVKAGQINMDELMLEIDSLQSTIQNLKGISLEHLRRAVETYENAERSLKLAEKSFLDTLNGEKYEEIQIEIEGLNLPEIPPNLDQINQSISKLETQIALKRNEFNSDTEKFQNWKREYGTYEMIFQKAGELTSKMNKLKEEIQNLPELPSKFQDFPAFVQYLSQLRQRWSQLQEERDQKIKGYNTLEIELGKISSVEELSSTLELKEHEFEMLVARAQSLLSIQKKSEDLLSKIESTSNETLTRSFLKWLSPMVGEQRFQSIDIQQNSPVSYNQLGYELLSHGTKDVLALAWRLTLAEYFLGDKKGLLILDDPMVDMDAIRQKRVAEVLKDFSKMHQVIYFTCHESQKAFFE
jgi:DNA repair protein SbcC/Rad50